MGLAQSKGKSVAGSGIAAQPPAEEVKTLAGQSRRGAAQIFAVLRCNPKFSGLLLIVAAVLLWIFFSLRSSIIELREQQKTTTEQLQQMGAALQQLEAKNVEQRERIETLDGKLSVFRPRGQGEPKADVKSLKTGLYTVTTMLELERVRRSGTISGEYTIYHIKAPIGTGETAQMINVGLAIGGITGGPQFYVDYDADNKVDAELLYDFVSLIPYAGLIGKTLSEDNSQKTYDRLRETVEGAEYMSLDEIEQNGSRVAKALWGLIGSQSEKLISMGQAKKTAPPKHP